MMGRPAPSPSLVAVALVLGACGSGTVSIGERTDTDTEEDTCPAVVVSSDSLVFTEAFFDIGARRSLEIDNRCIGQQALVLGEPKIIEGDPALWSLPPGPFEISPGGRLTLDIGFLPVEYGTAEARLQITSSDPTQREISVVLTGTASEDQDADGFRAVEVGGDDCDDDDPAVYPGRDERDDGKDQDCDGLIDEDFLRPGDVVITEIFALPSSEPRARQWFEVRNVSTRAVDLRGWTVSTAETSLRVQGTAVLGPGQTGVLARSADAEQLGLPREPTGVLVGAEELMTLVGSWELTLAAGANPVYILEGATFPRVQEGSALQLDPTITDPFQATRGDFWCQSTVSLPSGERGTPFANNAWCPQIDHDGDGTVLADDCDDADPLRFPGAREVLDGIDNDCDGTVDRFEVPGGQTGELTGLAFDRYWNFGSGDFDDDGQQDVVMMGNSNRRALLLDTALLSGTRSISSVAVDERAFGGRDPYPFDVARQGGDVDGDGVDDLLLVSWDFTFDGNPVGLLVSTDGDLTEDISVTFSDEFRLSTERAGVAVVDVNGDSRAEVLLGHGATRSFDGGVWLLDLDDTSGEVDVDDVAVRTLTPASGSRRALGAAVAGGDLDDDGYEDLIVREGARFGGANDAYLVAGALSPGDDGVIGDQADVVLRDVGPIDFNLPTRTPVTADLDDDGVLDLVIPSSDRVRVWYDGADLLTGRRGPDTLIERPSSGQLCGVDAIDADGDGTSGLVVGWSDAAWSGTFAVSYFDPDRLAASSTRLRLAIDDDGRITSPPRGDMFGCGVFAADVAGGTGDELFSAAGLRRSGTGALNGTLWYFQSP